MLAPMETGSTIVGSMSVSDLILGLSQGFLAVWISEGVIERLARCSVSSREPRYCRG